MSKVKIQGNASGTGVLTVTAPNTNTDRTITLPDGDVTLGAATPSIDDNGDATAITIDSSEKVNFNQGRLQLGHINKFIDTANYVGDAINIGSHPFANGTVIGQSYPADSPTTIKRTIHTTGTETKFFTVSGATETERVRIDQHGIKFNGDTAAANALDDYEEGTWTPTFLGGTFTNYASTGRYVKIGNMVHIQYYSSNATISSVSGVARITNLPYAPLNASNHHTVISYCHGNAVTGAANIYLDYSNATMYWVINDGTSSPSWVSGSHKFLMLTGTYQTA